MNSINHITLIAALLSILTTTECKCADDLAGVEFRSFYMPYVYAQLDKELLGEKFDPLDLCKKHYDQFFYSGRTICTKSDSTIDTTVHVNEIFCLPISCTYDEEILTEALPMFVNQHYFDVLEKDEDTEHAYKIVYNDVHANCKGEYTFKGLTTRTKEDVESTFNSGATGIYSHKIAVSLAALTTSLALFLVV